MRYFSHAKIDRAIVMTQYDLRGYAHPLGFRFPRLKSPKMFFFTTTNFMCFAWGAGGKKPRASTRGVFVDWEESSYDAYLRMCKILAKDCDLSEKEAIQLLVREFVSQNEELTAEVRDGNRKESWYIQSLSKNTPWGKVVLALAEAFEVTIKQPAKEA